MRYCAATSRGDALALWAPFTRGNGFQPLYFSRRLGPRDALQLVLPAEVGFEFREDIQHIEKRLAGGSGCVDGLLRRMRLCASCN